MTDVTKTTCPEFVSMNETDIDNLQKRAEYVDGVYQMVLGKAKRHAAKKTGDLYLVVPMRAVDDQGRAKGPVVDYWLHLLCANPEIPGHAPDMSRRDRDRENARAFIRAVMGNDALPQFAKKDASGKYVDPATGEEMDVEARKLRAREIDTKTTSLLLRWFNKNRETGLDGGAELEGIGVFAGIKRWQGRASVSYVRGDAPANKEVRYTDMTSFV